MFNFPTLAAAGSAFVLATLSCGSAVADILVTGSGFWDHATVVTPVGAPDATWYFSFRLPDVISENPTTEATQFDYRLNGVSVGMTLDDVEFFESGAGGLFDLAFTLNGAPGRLQLSGPLTDDTGGLDRPDVGSDLSLRLGTFDAELGNVFPAITRGVGTGTVTVTAVPEPAAWALMIAGFGLMGVRVRRRTATSAA